MVVVFFVLGTSESPHNLRWKCVQCRLIFFPSRPVLLSLSKRYTKQTIHHQTIQDLASVAEWLNGHKLTLNVAKSKFMIIGSSQRLKALGTFSLQISDEFLDKADCYKYLGVTINETLTWSDHVDYISTKVNQRLGILRRIKHLLPIHTRELYVKSMILPLLDYSDIVWGDKHNKTLMAKVQLLQNKTAKLILNKAKHSFATEAINELDWLVLSERRRHHRLSFVLNACMG